MLDTPAQDAWLKRVVEDCRSHKFITTLAGRRRYLPDIDHADRGRRGRAERQAINSTVQGSAADLCKAAMVSLADGVASAFPDTPKACRLILQARCVAPFARSPLLYCSATKCSKHPTVIC